MKLESLLELRAGGLPGFVLFFGLFFGLLPKGGLLGLRYEFAWASLSLE
jgi:hypothetical protein